MKKFLVFGVILFLFAGIASFAQDKQNSEHMFRIGFGPDVYRNKHLGTKEGGLILNFAVGDGNGYFRKIVTINSSVRANLLSAGYETDFYFKHFFVGPGVMLNRWQDNVPNPVPENSNLKNIKPGKWIDYTLVPYLGFGFESPSLNDPLEEGLGIFFTYRIGNVAWGHNNQTENHKSEFNRYGSWIMGLYYKF
ncbi:MAG: hypothetical protein AAB522_02135 [Patescibacteria group bacterium]